MRMNLGNGNTKLKFK